MSVRFFFFGGGGEIVCGWVGGRLQMGAKISKCYSDLKSLFNYSKIVLNFLLIGPHKYVLLKF